MDGQTQAISPHRLCSPLWNWCVGLTLTISGVIACYFWLDQPLVFFVHRNIADKTIFIWLQRPTVALPLLASLILAWCGLWTLMNRPFSRVQSIGLAFSLGFIATNFIINQLKYALGRTWPDTWIENNPSLIQNGAFGFSPFHGGPGFASFPSGHAAAVCAVMTVLWWSYPTRRPIYVACVTVVAVGLIGANYDFLSDILSAIFVGVSVGYVTTKISPSTRDLLHDR